MGKKIIPPHDPERIKRIMNEKTRMIGVDTEELNRQAREKKARMDQENLQSKDADARLLEWSRQVEKLQDQVQAARQTASQRLADALHQQAQDKRHRDAITKEQLRNNMTEEYHTQFGTSHR